jgi:hypothetical protein
MKLTTTKIRGQELTIEVNAGGTFTCDFGDHTYEAKTHAELLERLEVAVKKHLAQNPVDVTVIGLVSRDKRKMSYSSTPFEKGVGFVHALLTAKHERHGGTFLLRAVDGGQKFQVGSYSSEGTICRRLTVEESVEYMRLASAVVDAEKALAAFELTVKVNAQELLDAARKEGK